MIIERPARRLALLVVLLAAPGCGKSRPATGPVPLAADGRREQAESLWTRAMHEFTRGHWRKAATEFERVILELPAGDSLAAEARFRMAEAYFAQGNQLQAAREFRRVSDELPNARLAPFALLRAGDAYADLWRRPELDPTYGQTGMATYQELLNRYPDSEAAARARLRIAGLEESFARKQFKAALYYLRLKAYDSAILYLKDLAASWPRAQVTPEALLRLVGAYRALGYQEDVRETCGYIRRFHSEMAGLDQNCPVTADTASTGPSSSIR